MGCCGSGFSKVSAAEKEFQDAEIYFVWPSHESVDRVCWRKGDLKSMSKPFTEAKYEGVATTTRVEKGEWGSYWVKDNVKYLTPKTTAPTILRKILESDFVKGNLAKFGIDKIPWGADKDPQIADLPDGKFKDALAQVESLLPVNKWEVAPVASIAVGRYENDELQLTFGDKATIAARTAAADPKVQVAAARLKKKAAVEAVKALLNQLGIDLEAILGNVLEVFGVDPSEVDLQGKIDDMTECDVFAPLGDDEKALIATGTHKFKSTAAARYCFATDHTKVPVRFEWGGQVEKAVVRVWRFKDGKRVGDPIETVLQRKPAPADKPDKPAPLEWDAVVQLGPGRWAFQWEVDGKIYFEHGKPVPEGGATAGHYRVLEVAVIKPIFV